MKKKPTKKPIKKHRGGGAYATVSHTVIKGETVVGPPPVNPEASLVRAIKRELEAEVRSFRDKLVFTYKNINGRDMRREVAWYMEQLGLGILGDLEREKLAERTRLLMESTTAEK